MDRHSHSITPDAATAVSAFASRHIGTDAHEQAQMLQTLGYASLDAMTQALLPADITLPHLPALPAPLDEAQALQALKAIASRNRVLKSFIGQGYYGCHTPTVIQRNVLENPSWYTAYTPYQAEISQGRLQALLNFQTLVIDLTGLPVANASMLDEATAAAEAMAMARRCSASPSSVFVVHPDVHPQTLQVLRTRAQPLGWHILIPANTEQWLQALEQPHFGMLVQYPSSTGAVLDWRQAVTRSHAQQALCVAATDLLALTLLTPPGEWGADIAVGSSQRLGMPMAAGGPHAAFMACRTQHQRSLPGRLVGVSVDAQGQPALRLALQTREQHIRREKATSNICTAQVLPAVVASMYAVCHGPQGLREMALRIARWTACLAQQLRTPGWALLHDSAFDTLTIDTGEHTANIAMRAELAGVNLRKVSPRQLGISLDETTTWADLEMLCKLLGAPAPAPEQAQQQGHLLPPGLMRTSPYLTHPVFHRCRSETALLRYLRQLSDQDLALDRCMIPLGSCTMKLNATSEMLPISWPEFAHIHPYAPADQQQGFARLAQDLQQWLAQLTGYAGVSLQPNAGSQGEYAGLLAIRAWHAAQGQPQRQVCLIPASAHGTNPATAQMCGMRVVVVQCDAQGNIDLQDLRAQCERHAEQLACIMLTYPSTHGVFEAHIRAVCDTVRQHGGRVYIDGANMNAMVALAAPGSFGGDVSHLNLHKTFCIPHGGGGPGVGPVCVAPDLVPFLPQAVGQPVDAAQVGPVSAAPWGNAGVLPISWMYIRMMGAAGLRQATQTALLHANYISARLRGHYDTLYTDAQGRIAHECILDLRPFKERCGVTAEDVAKRLIDYGFHAPTLSFPVPGTLMVEPTESEPLAEIERFIDAMLAIREEIRCIEAGQWPRDANPLKMAPFTADQLLQPDWPYAFTRNQAAATEQLAGKYWPPVARVDNVHGDRNLVCACPDISAYLT